MFDTTPIDSRHCDMISCIWQHLTWSMPLQGFILHYHLLGGSLGDHTAVLHHWNSVASSRNIDLNFSVLQWLQEVTFIENVWCDFATLLSAFYIGYYVTPINSNMSLVLANNTRIWLLHLPVHYNSCHRIKWPWYEALKVHVEMHRTRKVILIDGYQY